MNRRDNYLRAARFEKPEYIPVFFHINAACWEHYPQDALQDLMLAHPFLFPNHKKPSEPVRPAFSPWARAGHSYTDPWGCVWESAVNGLTGAVVRNPLPDWNSFPSFVPPDPARTNGMDTIDWADIRAKLEKTRAAGGLVTGGLRHGHTFLQLTYIRGYENLIFDMTDDVPELRRLIQMVEDFNMGIIRRYLEIGVDVMGYAEDLGMQVGPMLSPDHFRTYIKPVYQRLMAPARDAGCLISMHSDGDIRQLAPDLIDSGVDIFNPQDLVNGIDWLAAHLKGRVCIDLDIDRQKITRFGTPQQIDDLIRTEVTTLGSREGGLMFTFGLYPGTPLENVKALMDALEKYATHFA